MIVSQFKLAKHHVLVASCLLEDFEELLVDLLILNFDFEVLEIFFVVILGDLSETLDLLLTDHSHHLSA
jgi:hypothetical protein